MTEKKRAPNSGSFKKGDPRIPAVRKRLESEAPESLPDPTPEERTLFEDMRHVRRYPKSADRTEGQKDARKWKNRDLKGFMTAYAALERVQPLSTPAQTKDEGTERVIELIDKLLTEAGCG